MLETLGPGAILIRGRLLKCPFMVIRLVCGVPLMMRRDYISELRPPTGLLLIPQVIYEHENS
jgi:hypothetical protein